MYACNSLVSMLYKARVLKTNMTLKRVGENEYIRGYGNDLT